MRGILNCVDEIVLRRHNRRLLVRTGFVWTVIQDASAIVGSNKRRGIAVASFQARFHLIDTNGSCADLGFAQVGDTVVVGVEGGIGGIERKQAPRDFPGIFHAVAISVGIAGVGAVAVFFDVCQTVRIAISRRGLFVESIKTIAIFEGIRETIAVGITVGSQEDGGQGTVLPSSGEQGPVLVEGCHSVESIARGWWQAGVELICHAMTPERWDGFIARRGHEDRAEDLTGIGDRAEGHTGAGSALGAETPRGRGAVTGGDEGLRFQSVAGEDIRGSRKHTAGRDDGDCGRIPSAEGSQIDGGE